MPAFQSGSVRRRGAVLIWVAVLGLVLVGFVGVAMDAGVVLLAGHHLQIAADAAALAGAAQVRQENQIAVKRAAYNIAHENKAAGDGVLLEWNTGNGADGDIVIGRYFRFADTFHNCPTPPCFFPQTDSPNAVRVRARRTDDSLGDQVPLVFGASPAFDVEGVDVARMATAMISGSRGAGMIVLDPQTDCSLDIRGSTVIDVRCGPGCEEASIQVNSDDDCAICGNGSRLEIHSPETNLVGNYCFNSHPDLDTYLNPDSPPIPDPLRDLLAPAPGTNRGIGIRNSGTYLPGYYPGGLEIGSHDVVVLRPGVYTLDGEIGGRSPSGGLQVGAGADLTAHEVMLYIKGGPVRLGGTASVTITAISNESDPYWGVSIFQARNNPNPAVITGTADLHLGGTYYFPAAKVDIQGNGAVLGNQLIAWQMQMVGNGTFTIDYDGRFPAPGAKVFLVE